MDHLSPSQHRLTVVLMAHYGWHLKYGQRARCEKAACAIEHNQDRFERDFDQALVLDDAEKFGHLGRLCFSCAAELLGVKLASGGDEDEPRSEWFGFHEFSAPTG